MSDQEQTSDLYGHGDRCLYVPVSPGPPDMPYWLKIMSLGHDCEKVLRLEHSEEIDVYQNADDNILAIQMPNVVKDGAVCEATIDGLRLILDEDEIGQLIEAAIAVGRNQAEPVSESGTEALAPSDFV